MNAKENTLKTFECRCISETGQSMDFVWVTKTKSAAKAKTTKALRDIYGDPKKWSVGVQEIA